MCFEKLTKFFCVAVLTLMLGACAHVDKTKKKEAATTGGQVQKREVAYKLTAQKLEERLADTVTSPLTDLNLMRAEISPALVAALKGPYLPLMDESCETIAAEVTELDQAIGPDFDAPVNGVSQDLIEKGGEELSNAAVGALRRTVDGMIPFRSWIRKFSGAERHSKELAAAIAAGIVRRSFIKGIGHANGCLAPAAPRV